MAPQSKRETEENGDVVKRLKGDVQADEKEASDLKAEKNVDIKKNDTTKEEENHNDIKNNDHADEVEKKTETKETVEKEDDANETEEPAKDEEVHEGTLLISGGVDWDMTGRKELPKNAKKNTNPAAKNLWGPHKVVLGGETLRVKAVFSGCNACHSVIITDKGETMTFGRNDKGQLGLGDTETRLTPTLVEGLKDMNVVAAACGRSHTLFLTDEGVVYACGDNKMGQCGTNQQSVHTITTPQRVMYSGMRITKVACGAEFSMILDEGGKLYSFGHPEHGQLGHNSEGKYFTSGNKYAFHCEYQPRRILTWIEKSREGHVSPVSDVHIIDVACGTNHTLAVDKKNRCFSWGFAGYHRLGHSETKNELVPRSVKLFDAPPSSGRGCARVFAGQQHSMALDNNGLLYFWGQNKSSGEATMYPKTVQDLCGWRIQSVACAARSIFVIAEDCCISWGSSPTYGELGYGEGKAKSSTTPQEVRTLDGVHVIDIACGFGHTMLIARDQTEVEQKTIDKQFVNWP